MDFMQKIHDDVKEISCLINSLVDSGPKRYYRRSNENRISRAIENIVDPHGYTREDVCHLLDITLADLHSIENYDYVGGVDELAEKFALFQSEFNVSDRTMYWICADYAKTSSAGLLDQPYEIGVHTQWKW